MGLHVPGPVQERERDLLQVPHFFVGTLQPLEADWKGRPQCVFRLSASVQLSLSGLPQGEPPVTGFECLGCVRTQGGGQAAGAALSASLPHGMHRPVAVVPQAAVPHLQVGRPGGVHGQRGGRGEGGGGSTVGGVARHAADPAAQVPPPPEQLSIPLFCAAEKAASSMGGQKLM